MDKKCENTTQVDKCWNFALNSSYLSLLFFFPHHSLLFFSPWTENESSYYYYFHNQLAFCR